MQRTSCVEQARHPVCSAGAIGNSAKVKARRRSAYYTALISRAPIVANMAEIPFWKCVALLAVCALVALAEAQDDTADQEGDRVGRFRSNTGRIFNFNFGRICTGSWLPHAAKPTMHFCL